MRKYRIISKPNSREREHIIFKLPACKFYDRDPRSRRSAMVTGIPENVSCRACLHGASSSDYVLCVEGHTPT